MYQLVYTQVVNCLNYSAVTFPVTEADKDIDISDPSYEPMNPKDKMNWEACECLFRHLL